MNGLPAGWAETTLGAIAVEVRNGISAKPDEDDGLAILRISAVRPGKLDVSDVRFLPNSFKDAATYALRQDDLLFTRYNGNPDLVGACARVPALQTSIVYPDKLIRVRVATSIVDPRFVEAAMRTAGPRNYVAGKVKTSAGQVGISGADLKSLRLAIAPLNEQRRIVAKLDAIFDRTRATRERLKRLPALLDKLKRSILAAAFRGELTKDWRAANPNVEPASKLIERTPLPEGKSSGRAAATTHLPGLAAIRVGYEDAVTPHGWQWIALSCIARMESGHTPSRGHPEYWDGEIPWIGIKDAREFHGREISATGQTVSALGLENSAARLLPAKTVCLSRTASVGYVTIMGREMATSQDFANWICSDALLPEYLMFALMAEGEHLRTFGEGTTHTTIYFPELKALQICLAPIEEQREIVRRVSLMLDLIERAKARLETQHARLDGLERAALAKAFRGELVAQDPADEPADQLLARIAADRSQVRVPLKGATGRRAVAEAAR